MARRLLVKNIHTLVTMNEQREEIRDGALLVRGNVDRAGRHDGGRCPTPRMTSSISKGRYIVMPGMVNTHHHFYQVLTRVVAPDGTLFPWLKALYPIWAKMRANDIYLSAQLAAAELLLSGCTTSSDHLYILPNDCTIDDEIRALQDIGMRFTAVRGSMSIGESAGGLPPDSVVEKEPEILKDSQRIIEQYHDMSRHAMLRIALGPCSPFTISEGLMKESADLARTYPGVRLHTHLAENQDDIAYMAETYGARPGEWTEAVGWLSDDVWHAHCVQLDDAEIGMFAKAGTGVAHCPCSNMRLASGAAPIRSMRDAGVKVALGVDGSASNDTSNFLLEARQALLLARVREVDVAGMTAREALADRDDRRRAGVGPGRHRPSRARACRPTSSPSIPSASPSSGRTPTRWPRWSCARPSRSTTASSTARKSSIRGGLRRSTTMRSPEKPETAAIALSA